MPVRLRRSLQKAGIVAASLALVACTSGTPAGTTSAAAAPSSASPTATAPSQTFTFGTAAQPEGLDPALTVAPESYRITRQIMEGLVGVDPNTSAPRPLLAESWTEIDSGRSYQFALRPHVTFQDGEPFNAAAVCANFDRWYNFPASLRGTGSGISFKTVFKAFSDTPGASLYQNCQPLGELQVRINLTSRTSGFIASLSQPAFAMSAPNALREQQADQLTETRNGVPVSKYAEHPVGTGPFVFDSWSGDQVVLRSNPTYWGDRGQIEKIVFVTLAQPEARLRALEKGTIDAYDLVTVSTVTELARQGLQVLHRDPFSILYLGINQAFPGMDNLKMRQAVAHAIDKPTLLNGLFLSGTKPANQFVPPKLGVTSDGVAQYGYDPALAKQLLKEAGYQGQPLPFYYPLNVNLAYLPAPEKVYAELSRQLTAAGFNIKPVPINWSDGYVDKVQSSTDRAFDLLGWTGSYQDPDTFMGPLFGAATQEFGFSDQQLFSRIEFARSIPDGPDRVQAYKDIATLISTELPAVPLAFPISAVALSNRVTSYPISPVLDEVFNKVTLQG